jgi:type IV secretion system protein TrbL
MKGLHKTALIGAVLALYSTAALAQLTNQGMLDQVVTKFATRATAWQTVVMDAAMYLFWTLGTISLVFTFGFMALRKADIGEFFAEFIRFILFFGFFLWLLRNGPNFANSIIQSLSRIGEQASGESSITPSGIVDVGFMIWKQAISNLSAWSPIDSFVGVALSAGILILLALIAVNMLLLLVSAWLLAYAGIFFLGFGGSRWTSDMAINYYKTVLGVAVQIMTMVLLVGIGSDLLSTFYAKMNKGTLNFEELGVMLVFCLALMLLVNRVPPLVSGIITGASINHAGIGNFGTGAVVGAAGMAAAAAATGGAMLAASAANAAGGANALAAAFSKASENVQSGSDVLTSLWGGGNGGSNEGGKHALSTGNTSYAQAAGYASSDRGFAANAEGRGGSAKGKPRATLDPGQPGTGESRDSAGSGGARKAEGGPQPSSGGLMSSVGHAGRIAADTAANLAKGTAQVAMEKIASVAEAAGERVADTTGGRIAAALKSGNAKDEGGPMVEPAPTFEGNALAGAGTLDADAAAEVAAFVNRDRPSPWVRTA